MEIKPFYQNEKITIYLGDCREVLPQIGAIDASAIITDPPYGDTSLVWDAWPVGWIDAALSVVPPTAPLWLFGSMRMFLDRGAEISGAGLKLAQDIIWEKHNGSSFLTDRFKRVHEHVVQWYRKDTPWADIYRSPVLTGENTKTTKRRKTRPPHLGGSGRPAYESQDGGPKLMRSVIQVRSCHGYAIHPTEKPLGIINPLVEYSTPRGGLILDPFAGSGAVLESAMRNGRRAIGIESQEKYCEAAANRFSQSVLQW